MARLCRASILAVFVLLGISIFSLFINPVVGLADNGDFYRVMVTNDIKHEKDRDINDYFGYFNHSYDKIEYYNELYDNFKSTQNIVVRAAVLLDDIFTQDDKFDIRFHALLCLLVLAGALYLLIESAMSLTKNRKLQYLMAFLAVVIFGDIGYLTYFNSFFGEAISYPFFLLSVGAMLRFSTCEKPKIRYIILFFIGSIFFIGAKNQFAANGLVALAMLLMVIIFSKIDLKGKILTASLGVAVLVSMIFFYTAIDTNLAFINKYHMITRGVTLYEPDVGKATQEARLDRQYALLTGTIYFDSMPVIDPKDPLLLADFYPKYDLVSVTWYYFSHPDAFHKIMEMGWRNSYSIRTQVLGNYERSAGRGFGEKTNFFSVWSTLKEDYFPHTSGIVYTLFILTIILGINRIIRNKRIQTKKEYIFFEFTLIYVVLTALSQILVSLIGAGDTDLRKHVFMTTVSLDLLLYFNLVYVLSLLWKNKKSRKE